MGTFRFSPIALFLLQNQCSRIQTTSEKKLIHAGLDGLIQFFEKNKMHPIQIVSYPLKAIKKLINGNMENDPTDSATGTQYWRMILCNSDPGKTKIQAASWDLKNFRLLKPGIRNSFPKFGPSKFLFPRNANVSRLDLNFIFHFLEIRITEKYFNIACQSQILSGHLHTVNV